VAIDVAHDYGDTPRYKKTLERDKGNYLTGDGRAGIRMDTFGSLAGSTMC
jgi:hypothetical protein